MFSAFSVSPSLAALPVTSTVASEAFRDAIKTQTPIIVTGSHLCSSAQAWNLDYLCNHMPQSQCSIYESASREFMYFDTTSAKSLPGFTPPTRLSNGTVGDFRRRISDTSQRASGKRVYLQQPLNETVGKRIMQDFVSFDWGWIESTRREAGWDELTTNLLLISQPGNITPAHYDEQQNFLCQLVGRKRVMLFGPDQFSNLYPFPVSHPCDRQSQVNFSDPDLARFPNFSKLRGFVGDIGPGDFLYIPMYWWHHVESEAEPVQGHTVSVTFWFKYSHKTSNGIDYPLKPTHKVAIMRNVEKMLFQAMGGDHDEVKAMLTSMVSGRYASVHDVSPPHIIAKEPAVSLQPGATVVDSSFESLHVAGRAGTSCSPKSTAPNEDS